MHSFPLPLFSELEPVLLSGAGSMSSYPQDTMCFPPSKQDGDPGPPSKSSSLWGEELQRPKSAHSSKPEVYLPAQKANANGLKKYTSEYYSQYILIKNYKAIFTKLWAR